MKIKHFSFSRFSAHIIVVICAVLFFSAHANVGALTLKVASLAPQNSVWGRLLESLGSDFRSITSGEVELRIFHNGIAGGEPDVIRKSRLGQIDMVVVTSLGVGLIDDSVLTLSVPGLITTADEFDHVLNKFSASLQKEINDTRYEVLGWAGIAWLYPFSTEKFRSPQDLRRAKIGSSETNENLNQFYRDLGFNPVPLAISEWLTALNSGLINGFLASPTATAGFQWFGIADNMANVQLAPFIGAVIVTDRAWAKVDNKYKPDYGRPLSEN